MNAQEKLEKFVELYERIYGLRFMTANVHALLHLAETVIQSGPLYVLSCFPFEDLNGKMTRLVHSKQRAEIQVYESFISLQKLPCMITEIQTGSVVGRFIQGFRNLHNSAFVHEVVQNVYVLDKISRMLIIPSIVSEAIDRSNVIHHGIWFYNRLLKEGITYVAKGYSRSLSTISYCVSYGQDSEIGIVHVFIKARTCSCDGECDCAMEHFAVIEECHVTNLNYGDGNYTSACKKLFVLDSYILVSIYDLQYVNYLMKVNSSTFVATPTNLLEFE